MIFYFLCTKIYVVGTRYNHLGEVILTNTHNIYFGWEIKSYPQNTPLNWSPADFRQEIPVNSQEAWVTLFRRMFDCIKNRYRLERNTDVVGIARDNSSEEIHKWIQHRCEQYAIIKKKAIEIKG